MRERPPRRCLVICKDGGLPERGTLLAVQNALLLATPSSRSFAFDAEPSSWPVIVQACSRP